MFVKNWEYQLTAICCHGTGCIGLFCPCFLFGKNAEFLGSGTLTGSCATHFVLWALFNSLCCLLTDGLFFGFPGCFVACYACGYRQALRSKYNLQVWHLHLCSRYSLFICYKFWFLPHFHAFKLPGHRKHNYLLSSYLATWKL